MELCENRTLKHVITEEKLFTNPKRVKELFGQICQGMQSKFFSNFNSYNI